MTPSASRSGISKSDFFNQIKALQLPPDQFVVVGGCIMVALGLLEAEDDIDIAVTQTQFESFRRQGWKEYRFQDKSVLKHGIYDVGVNFGPWTLADLQSDALIINDIAFINPRKCLRWKQEFNRPKDQPHIKLLQAYLNRT
jgi:hypothetical protein